MEEKKPTNCKAELLHEAIIIIPKLEELKLHHMKREDEDAKP